MNVFHSAGSGLQLSVGICAYNEEKNIGHLLENIFLEQQVAADCEVLVVCSGCTDNTVNIVQNYAKKEQRLKVYVEKERTGKASAINQILANAKSKTILFISADTLPNEHCFESLVSKLEDAKVGLVCGKPVPVNNSNSLTDKLVQLLWQSHDYIFQYLSEEGVARHASEVYCVRAGIVDRIPRELINDDAFIALTAKKKGWLIIYDPKAVVSICGPQTFSDYFIQRKRVLIGHWQVKKSTGDSPQHLIYLLPIYPKKVVKLLFDLWVKYGLFTFAFFIWIEFLINLSTLPARIRNKAVNKWSVSSSTKEVIKY